MTERIGLTSGVLPWACTDALKDRAVSYSGLTPSLSQMKGCLTCGNPFVFGVTVYVGVESLRVRQRAVVPMPFAGESGLGRYGVTAVGYDENEHFHRRQRLGTGWSIGGSFTMPYARPTGGSTLCPRRSWSVVLTALPDCVSDELCLERRREIGRFEFHHPKIRIRSDLAGDIGIGGRLIDRRDTGSAQPCQRAVSRTDLREHGKSLAATHDREHATRIRIPLAQDHAWSAISVGHA